MHGGLTSAMSSAASTEHDPNPYRSPEARADARARLGWLVMLVILWPIVMAAAGSILGFFVGRLSFDQIDPTVWNPAIGALAGAVLFSMAGFCIGFRKAMRLRGRLNEIHARREEIRQELRRRTEAL